MLGFRFGFPLLLFRLPTGEINFELFEEMRFPCRLHSGGSAHSFGEYSCLATSKMLREYSSLSDLEFNEILSGKACQTTQPQPAMRLHLDGMPPWLNLRDMFFPDKGADKRSSSGAHSDKGGIREEILSMKLMVTGDQLNMLFKHVTAT